MFEDRHDDDFSSGDFQSNSTSDILSSNTQSTSEAECVTAIELMTDKSGLFKEISQQVGTESSSSSGSKASKEGASKRIRQLPQCKLKDQHKENAAVSGSTKMSTRGKLAKLFRHSDGRVKVDHVRNEKIARKDSSKALRVYKDLETRMECIEFEADNTSQSKTDMTQKRKKFRCKLCAHETRRKYTMKEHILSIHDGERQLCWHCGKEFKTHKALHEHVRNHHRLEKMVCETCGATFGSAEGLRLHRSIHSNYGESICVHCLKQFSSVRACQTHVQAEHQGLRHPCPRCGKVFKYKATFYKHRQTCGVDGPVLKHKCTLCHKMFTRKDGLTTHMQAIHCALKQYACEHCGVQFKFRGALHRHRKKQCAAVHVKKGMTEAISVPSEVANAADKVAPGESETAITRLDSAVEAEVLQAISTGQLKEGNVYIIMGNEVVDASLQQQMLCTKKLEG